MDFGCDPYFTDNGWDAPESTATGGQCDTFYKVVWQENWEVRECSDDSVASTVDRERETVAVYRGPLTFSKSYEKKFDSCGDGKVSTWLVGGLDADGSAYNTGPRRQELINRYVAFNNTTATFVRTDGLPDDCGDPPREPGENLPPDEPWEGEIDPPGLPPGGPPVTLKLPDINVDVNPDLEVCVGLVCSKIALDVDSDSTPPPKSDRPKDLGPPLGPGDLGSGPGEDGDLPDAPPGSENIGVFVFVQVDESRQPPIPGTEGAPVYPAIVANVALKYEDDNGETFVATNNIQRSRFGLYLRDDNGVTVKGVLVDLGPAAVSYTVRVITSSKEPGDG